MISRDVYSRVQSECRVTVDTHTHRGVRRLVGRAHMCVCVRALALLHAVCVLIDLVTVACRHSPRHLTLIGRRRDLCIAASCC